MDESIPHVVAPSDCPSPRASDDVVLPKFRHRGEPERYRLPATKPVPEDPRPRTKIRFRFRSRLISASSTPADASHPHVLRLDLDPSSLERSLRLILDFLPPFARSWAEFLFPEWFLPTHIILKRRRVDPEVEVDVADELFGTEVRAYRRLKQIQGSVVPICYGEARYNKARALVLQDIGGVSLAEPAGATLTLHELSWLLQQCHRALHAFGVHHGDPQLGNFRFVDGKLMAVDLETASFDRSAEYNTTFMNTNIWDMASRYRDIQKMFRRQGLLEAA